jgi:hypothetical protein
MVMVLSEYPTSHRNGFLAEVKLWKSKYYSQGSPLMILRIALTVLLLFYLGSSICLQHVAFLSFPTRSCSNLAIYKFGAL